MTTLTLSSLSMNSRGKLVCEEKQNPLLPSRVMRKVIHEPNFNTAFKGILHKFLAFELQSQRFQESFPSHCF